MKLFTAFLQKLYQYTTVFIVLGSPLFFIPKTGFTPDTTYYVTMSLLVAVALFSYVVSALITKTWHSVSKLEFISYFLFSFSVLGSVLFSKNPAFTLFGDVLNQYSGAALLSLPVIMYLVRTLPESLRHTLKYILLAILGISTFVFTMALMMSATVGTFARNFFSGFSSSISFGVYIGIFAAACLFFVVKSDVKKRHKIAVFITALLLVAWTLALSTQDGVRPNLPSTLIVGKSALIHDGVFGIGSGNFARAWQLYRPQTVISSVYFGYDFNQGSSTMTTFFVTVGIVGLISFMMLVLSALYSTFISFRQNREGKEHFIIGLLFVVILYFVGVSWVVPLTYSMLVVWMVVSGLGLAKAKLTEFHPSKKIAFLMVPLALLLIVNAAVTLKKVRAFMLYTKVQALTDPNQVAQGMAKVVKIYPYDGFYRVQVENDIQLNRNLVATETTDQEALKNKYFANAQLAADAGLAAVKSNPQNYQNYVSLGRAYELMVPFDKERAYTNAKNSYNEAIKLYPENPYLYLMAARLESSAGTKEGVREKLTEALKKKQNFADALYLMSQLEASDSKMDEALNYAIEAVKNAPNDPAAYVQAGLLFYGKKDYVNAVYALKTALEKDQNNANIAYFLALSLRDVGRPDLAKQIGDELLRRNPGNADLQAFLSSLVPKQDAAAAPVTNKKTAKPVKK